MYRLYYSPGACSMVVHIVLEEIGEPYELELVSSSGVREGSMTGTPAWKAINPKGRVPALLGVPGRIGGADALLTELPAILLFLARTNPKAHLLPANPAAEARCLEWMNFLSGAVHAMSYGLVWRANRFSNDDADFPALQAKGRANLREQYGYIEGLLADGRDWAVPGGYSIVDADLLVFYQWGQRIGFEMQSDCPAWTALMQRVVARPAVQRVLAAEKVKLW
jgi:glutathione S-transferase